MRKQARQSMHIFQHSYWPNMAILYSFHSWLHTVHRSEKSKYHNEDTVLQKLELIKEIEESFHVGFKCLKVLSGGKELLLCKEFRFKGLQRCSKLNCALSDLIQGPPPTHQTVKFNYYLISVQSYVAYALLEKFWRISLYNVWLMTLLQSSMSRKI